MSHPPKNWYLKKNPIPRYSKVSFGILGCLVRFIICVNLSSAL